MSSNDFLAKLLRFLGIVLMALTGAFTLLGGVGTTCAALAPTKYDTMKALAPFQWLYILFVLTGIAIGIWGIWATIKLVRGLPDSYKMSLQALIAGVLVGGFHIYMSRLLRGKSMPVDAVVYTTLFTLIVFLLFRIPPIWQGVDFTKAKSGEGKKAGGAAAILVGMFALTIQYTMGSTHTWGGVNYADAFNTSMTVIGSLCLMFGAGIFFGSALREVVLNLHENHRLKRITTSS
jgi:predicted small integral membrane protein